jgi:hypothetical protein
MTKPAFDIIPADWDQEELLNSMLLIEISDKLFGYVIYNKHNKSMLGLRQYHLDVSTEKPTIQALNEIFANDGLLQQSWKEAVVIYNFPDSSLLPDEFFDLGMNKSITELLFGNAFRELILSEKIPAWDVYNIYRIKREIHGAMQQKFSAGRYWHYYSILLSTIDKEKQASSSVLKCIFYPEKFIVALITNQQLQLLQTYDYETPEDVSYYLLKISRQFNIVQGDLRVNVSGLIEEQSVLFSELLKYFEYLECDRIPETLETRGLLEGLPGHYFSPMLKMAVCV